MSQRVRDQQTWGALSPRRLNVFRMPFLKDPSVTLEEVRIRKVTLSALNLDVAIRVRNPNLVGVTLREIPFIVLFRNKACFDEIANGNTGKICIKARDTVVFSVPVTSRNTALLKALATFVVKGGIEVTVRGKAVVEAVITGWSVPFESTMLLTMDQVADALKGKPDKQ